MSPKLLVLGLCLSLGFGLWLYRGFRIFANEVAGLAPGAEPVMWPPELPQPAGLRRVTWTVAGAAQQVGWYVPSRNRAAVVFVHGSPGNRNGGLSIALPLIGRGYGALLVDMPGHGESAGPPTWDHSAEQSLVGAVDFLMQTGTVEPNAVGLFAYSMGTSIAARVAAIDRRISALVLAAAFTNLTDQLRHEWQSQVPLVSWFAVAAAMWEGVPVWQLVTSDAVQQLGERPLLLLAGQSDRAVPPSMPRELQTLAGAHTELIEIPDATHVDLAAAGGSEYEPCIAAFFDRALKPSAPLALRTPISQAKPAPLDSSERRHMR